MDERKLQIIANLLRLKESDNEHEAAQAAKRAQEMMLKYGYTEADLTSLKDPAASAGPTIVEREDKPAIRLGYVPPWKARLLNVICRANACIPIKYCKHIQKPDGTWFGKRGRMHREYVYTVLGPEQRVPLVLSLYWHLEGAIKGLQKQYKGRGQKWLNAWRHGVVDMISKRLREAKEEVRKSDSTAIVLVDRDQAAVEAHADKHYGKAKAARSTQELDEMARLQGCLDGREVALGGGLSE